ncbi:MAG: homocysteine S-methyltransferase family protein [Verrucomicrobiales bacterium]|nr:homocysteine S-methyltransferase family protein [Verrucomicrobiales bacterium]
MHPTLLDLIFRRPVITDGAWGTELQKQGLSVGEFPDAWNLQYPDRVRAVASSYVEAGSRVILTNTFGSNRVRLADAGLADKVEAINGAGVRISKEAAGQRAKVFASIGPSGKMLLTGDVTSAALRDAFVEQAKALAGAGADGLVVETMSDLSEARVAVEAAKATGLPVVACMVYDSGRLKDRTMMGTTPEQAAEALAASGADVIGANCGQGVEGFVAIARRLRAATGVPLWIKANAGLPEFVDGKAVYRTTAAEFAQFLEPLVEAGADFVGGCCGTGPAFIRALVEAMTKVPPRSNVDDPAGNR